MQQVTVRRVQLDRIESQPPSAAESRAPPSHGRALEALRPACASCSISFVSLAARNISTTAFSDASFWSLYKPRQPGVILPSGLTALSSTVRRPAPDSASVPKCAIRQPLALPSCAEYWHIGEIMMRLDKGIGPRAVGEKSLGDDMRFLAAQPRA
jgi:hypothetical protein